MVKPLNDLQQAVALFRDHMRDRESRQMSKLMELDGLNQTLTHFTAAQSVDPPNMMNVELGMNYLLVALRTFGQVRESRMKDDSDNLDALTRQAGEVRKAATELGKLLANGGIKMPVVGQLTNVAQRVQEAVRKRAYNVREIEGFKI